METLILLKGELYLTIFSSLFVDEHLSFCCHRCFIRHEKRQYTHHPHFPHPNAGIKSSFSLYYKIALKAINVLIYNLSSTVDFVILALMIIT
jgi:hypothetical protein